MKTIISALLATFLLSLTACTFTDAKCTIIPKDNDNSTGYWCFNATLDDVNDIPNDAELIRFTVSKLSYLPERAFSRFILHGLSFYKCELEHIDPNAFDGLERLKELTLYGSNIHVLQSSWFKDMSDLTYLFLDGNDMVYIEPNIFPSIPNLEYLNIENNNLNCLTKHALMPLSRLKYVRIDKNPWLCDCYAELVEWMRNRQIDYRAYNKTETKLECMVEDSEQSGDFKVELNAIDEYKLALLPYYLSINRLGNVLCVGCDISILSQIPNNVKSIKFLNSKIPVLSRYTFFRFGNSLKSLELSNCTLNDIHLQAFAGLSKLEQLILFNNSIGMVRAEWFRDLHGLKHLAMDSNKIEYIQPDTFPLVDKLETLNLNENDIGCFPLRAFHSLKYLREFTISNNTWICSCLEDFRKWLHLKNKDYTMLPTQCTDKKTYKIGKQSLPGYRNTTFEQDFENEEKKIMIDNAKLVSEGAVQDAEPIDGVPAEIAVHENDRVGIAQLEFYHRGNKELSDYEYNRFGMQTNKLLQTERSTSLKKSYISVGGTIWDIVSIPADAEEIEFKKCAIPKITNQDLGNRVSLRILKVLYCGLQEIEQQAFERLVHLQELILDDNELSVVKSAWFENTPDLERLSLLRNAIGRIEIGAFQFLPNLKYLGIADNRLNCIGIEGLSDLKKIDSIDVGNNPWSCLCHIKLSEWLVRNNIKYDTNFFDREAEWDCMKEYQSLKITEKKYENRNFGDDGKFDETAALMRDASEYNIDFEEKIQSDKAIMNSKNKKTTEETITNSTVTSVQPIVSTTIGVKVPESSHGQCQFHQFNRPIENRWRCTNGNISILDKIPSNAERIDIVDSNITIIPDNAFIRFSNLTKLILYNSSICDVEPLAFATLNKLEWLIFLNNSIPTVRSSWFHDLVNVTLLGLVRNSITEIEPEVFDYLPNLEHLFVQENNLRCIYTKSLSSLKNLKKVGIQNNPWKSRCRDELIQFFEYRNMSYQYSENYDAKCTTPDLLLDNNSK